MPIHYDPLIGKIIIWGATREHALARSARALRECALSGIPSTLLFHRWLLDQPAFLSGSYDTAYLTNEFRGTARAVDARDEEDAVVLAALYARTVSRGPRFAGAGEATPGSENGQDERSRWRTAQPTFRRQPRSR